MNGEVPHSMDEGVSGSARARQVAWFEARAWVVASQLEAFGTMAELLGDEFDDSKNHDTVEYSTLL
jgi:hypothetical protein